MKKLLILLLLPSFCLGQADMKQLAKGPVYSGTGNPTRTGYNDKSLYLNLSDKSVWYYTSATSKWTKSSDPNQIGIVTGLQGQQGVKGDKGDPGIPGVCPSCPPSGGMSFPFIVVMGTGGDDTQLMQTAINQNAIDNRAIYTIGTGTFKDLTLAKNQYRFHWNNYSGTFSLGTIKRIGAADISEATGMTTARHVIEGGEIIGDPTKVTFDLGQSYGAVYRDIKIRNSKLAIYLRFALNTTIQNCEFMHCIKGIGVDIDNCPGAAYNLSNAQSNSVLVMKCRFVSTQSTICGIYVYGCSGFVGMGNIFEGHHFVNAVDKDWKGCPNDKDFKMMDSHIEPIAGNTSISESYFKIRLVGIATIDGVYSQYPGMFVDAGGVPNAGELTVEISKVAWVVKDGTSTNKIFNNYGMTHFIFRANSYQTPLNKSSQLSGLFSGVPVKEFKGVEDPIISGKIIEAPTTGNQTPNTYLIQ